MNPIQSATLILLLAAGSASAQTPAPQTMVPATAPAGTVQASVDLGAEFPFMKGYELAQTYFVVPPQTGRAMHSHAGTPEVVRVISGTLTDEAKGGAPTAYGPGSTIVNAAGKEHMWANFGTEPVVFVATAVRLKK